MSAISQEQRAQENHEQFVKINRQEALRKNIETLVNITQYTQNAVDERLKEINKSVKTKLKEHIDALEVI